MAKIQRIRREGFTEALGTYRRRNRSSSGYCLRVPFEGSGTRARLARWHNHQLRAAWLDRCLEGGRGKLTR